MEVLKAKERKNLTNHFMNFCTCLGLLSVGIFVIHGYMNGLFTSTKVFRDYIVSFGIWAPIVFILIQIIQVIIPILPGAIGCVAGVIIFGPWLGLLYNYIGICIGSMIVFILAKRYGRQFVKGVVREKSYEKYIEWVNKGKRFERMFVYAILFPVAPDDLLCYIAGLTKMKLRKFMVIILLGKPIPITIYSLGMAAVIQYLMDFMN
ncbi:TVP38/TMEM64 family protein [Psychrobacillus sp. NEAU-3TGS]|uniref:TVP38/TMEM64 family protein n=1 Tax=Psychrobacillus sp. NEAU-3TGS TaxID=2995412 RepID=UPI0024983379|nr:TVP38/TMEM64 family protein [Psychrobacillus sp. NEAU-3TGS]MDI2588439.1 TVP38/TMEM64 family protein [Psychrobacillus sp. NEAU-3TGS]